jgi:putative heme-binding domain-containing protein
VAATGDREACARLYRDWGRLSRATRGAILAVATRTPAAAEALVAALVRGTVARVELPLPLEAELRRSHADALAEVLASPDAADREAVVATAAAASLELEGDPSRGAALFADQCLSCHAVAGYGAAVGPDITSVASRAATELLVDILDPSRRLSPDYLGYTAVTRTGEAVAGILVAETERTITLRGERGEERTLARDDVATLAASAKSLMPDGFEERLTSRDLADVIAFLRRPERTLLERQ